MFDQFTLGIEEEFQTIDPVTRNLRSHMSKLVEDGKITDARKNGSIIMFDESLKEIARWNFVNGWPSKVNGPQLQADSNAYGIEELTIVHEGIVRAT